MIGSEDPSEGRSAEYHSICSGLTKMLERIFKSETGPGPVEYVLLLMVLTVAGLAVVRSAPKSDGVPMTQKPVSVESNG
ncbi:MAG: hypothetical protein ACK480_10710 [Planctomycetota bacterium]|jgi:hypothetical protein|nr:hypothetical protein [Planctomycetaceae bacterium]MCE2811778.1 hypothetical protein [Planctomycetaceae bacterium]